MVSVNTIILGGHLGADPEEKRGASGKLLCTFNLAVNRWDSRAEGEVVDWHSIVAFDKQAESCVRYLRKGSAVLVEGRVVTSKWEAPDGKRQTRYEVQASRVAFLGGRGGDGAREPVRESEREPVREPEREPVREAVRDELPQGMRPLVEPKPRGVRAKFADSIPF